MNPLANSDHVLRLNASNTVDLSARLIIITGCGFNNWHSRSISTDNRCIKTEMDEQLSTKCLNQFDVAGEDHIRTLGVGHIQVFGAYSDHNRPASVPLQSLTLAKYFVGQQKRLASNSSAHPHEIAGRQTS